MINKLKDTRLCKGLTRARLLKDITLGHQDKVRSFNQFSSVNLESNRTYERLTADLIDWNGVYALSFCYPCFLTEKNVVGFIQIFGQEYDYNINLH